MKTLSFELFENPRQSAAAGSTVDNPLSVLDLTLRTRDVVESKLKSVWVRGEVSDFKKHRNGHWYFCLRDRDAQIKCVVWLADQYRLPAAPDDGMQVVLFGHMTVFAARGDLQLKVLRIDAEGEGLWRKAMELTLAKLRQEGLLDESRKRAIPRYPRCIAVVTSPDGAALRDIVAVLRKRNSGARVVVCAAAVQGDTAAGEVAAAIRRVGRWGKANVLIVGRGGGAKDDLWAFNDERVARAVATCPIPVISAVGHEVDLTICDAVADLRAPTPSAAATAACVAHDEMRKVLSNAQRDLAALIAASLSRSKERIQTQSRILASALPRDFARRRAVLGATAARLNALSPLATLARGYAVARDKEGNILTSAQDFEKGLEFLLQLHDGRIEATTTKLS